MKNPEEMFRRNDWKVLKAILRPLRANSKYFGKRKFVWIEHCVWFLAFCFFLAIWFLLFSLITMKAEGFPAPSQNIRYAHEKLIFKSNNGVINTTRAVIHHTASPSWTTVADIDRWHKERGWDEIGYHFVIYANGQVKKGRSLDKRGAHNKGYNHWVGIALVGNDEFNVVQIKALRILLKNLKTKKIKRHHEKCPGKGIKKSTFVFLLKQRHLE